MKKQSYQVDYRHGTYQSDRLPSSLSPSSAPIDGRTFDDLIAQCVAYAGSLKYIGDDLKEHGDWSVFFRSICTEHRDADGNVTLSYDPERLQALEYSGDVPAHLGLLLAFLRILGVELDNLNQYTERHLDYYYKELLQFSPKSGTPGTVPVTFELNRNASGAVIPKGTRFPAGKDAEGREITYVCGEDAVLNATEVTDVVVMELEEDSRTCSLCHLDGTPPEGTFGFYLLFSLLKPGSAQAEVKLACPEVDEVEEGNEVKPHSLLECFTVEYSSAEGWEPCLVSHSQTLTRASFSTTSGKGFSESTEEIHGWASDQGRPLLRFVLKEVPAWAVERLRSLKPRDIRVLSVSYSSVTDLSLFHDGILVENRDGARPFGIQPGVGALLRVISPYFDTSLQCFTMHAAWQTPEETGTDPHVFGRDDLAVPLKLEKDPQEQLDLKKFYEVRQESPGLTVEIRKDFGHSTYRNRMMKAVLRAAGDEAANLPLSPYIPVLASPITLDVVLDASKGEVEEKVWTFTPLGAVPGGNSLLPERMDADYKRHLYVAMGPCEKDTSVRLFFQMDSHSADPAIPVSSADIPDLFFLEGDTWIPFKKGVVLSNTTDGFRASGVMRIALPSEDFSAHSLMPSGKTWIRISYGERKGGFPLVSSVTAQVIELECDPASEGNPPFSPLPAGSITKTSYAVKGVKKVLQPFDGNAGVEPENQDVFRCRVSERLRHKDRAWNIWDYERLVLEAFPSVAAVVCIPSRNEYGEFQPGHVLILALPDTSSGKGSLKPRLGTDTVAGIQSHLKARMSPFITLHVAGPQYEEIRIECTVALREGLVDKQYYKERISDELVGYLAPWSRGAKVSVSNNHSWSRILYFIENLPYVDFIKEMRIFVGGQEISEGSDIMPMGIRSVLTSSDSHDINII